MISDLERLIDLLAKLPGLGKRSARRAALQLLKQQETLLQPLITSLERVAEHMTECSICGNWDVMDPCPICSDPKRETTTLCVVEEVADLWAMERSHIFKGRYHVLGGTLSALDGRGPESLRIEPLIKRMEQGGINEVILATNATVEGQTTAHYLTERLRPFSIKISRLSHGLPIGGELDYLDEGTLSTALEARQTL